MRRKANTALLAVLTVMLAITTDAQNIESSGRKEHKTYCDSADFYCPYDSTHHCRPRSARCLLESERTEQSCLNPRTHQEEGCRGNPETGVFEIYDGWTHLLSTAESVSRSHHRLKHEFVTYRGFTYEYGQQGISILDTGDPYYKYKTKKVTKFTKVGTSRCKMENFSNFFQQWERKKYNIFTHNCQHFADALIHLIKDNCMTASTLKFDDGKIADVRHQKIQATAEYRSFDRQNIEHRLNADHVEEVAIRQEFTLGSEVSLEYADDMNITLETRDVIYLDREDKRPMKREKHQFAFIWLAIAV
ncbi:uncharacterized protein [Ptychodera flava]|uniref:uncharacterized protein n=1 Tax=Ptychodera flava TaxID=63121 RepID=UPI00396A89DF